MSINLNLGGQVHAVSTRFVLAALTSDSLKHALAQRNSLEKFTDFFHFTHHKAAIETLFAMTYSPNSSALQNSILKLSHLTEDPEAFKSSFRLRVGQVEGKSVATLSLDNSYLAHVKFHNDKNGEFALSDKLFYEASESTATSKVYMLKTTAPANLKPVIDRIADPDLFKQKLQACKQAISVKSVSDDSFAEMKKDLGRATEALPRANTTNTILPGQETSREGIVADIFVTSLSGAHEIFDSNGGTDLVPLFLDMSLKELEEQKAVLSNLASSNPSELSGLGEKGREFLEKFELCPKEKQALLKQALFLLNPQVLVSDDMVQLYQQGLGKLSNEDKQKFLLEFKPIRFVGAPEKFKEKVNTLPIQYQALLHVSTDQLYQSPLDGFALDITSLGGNEGQLRINATHSRYSIELLEASAFDDPLEVKIKYCSHHELQQEKNGGFTGNVVAHQEVSAIYTVKFKQDKKLQDASVELSDYNVELTVHNDDGTFTDCVNTFSQNARSEDLLAAQERQASAFAEFLSLFGEPAPA